MDMRSDGWWCQLRLGDQPAIQFNGSLASVLGQCVSAIQSSKLRAGRDGKHIVIQMQDSIPNAAMADRATQAASSILKASMDSAYAITMRDGESFEESIDRLFAEGYPKAMARTIACDWHDIEDDSHWSEHWQAWMNDPKAIRFRELNGSSAAFESALPSEYQQMLEHCRLNYAVFLENIVLRVAL